MLESFIIPQVVRGIIGQNYYSLYNKFNFSKTHKTLKPFSM